MARARVRAIAIVATSALVAPLMVALDATPAFAVDGTVSGTVFRDYNSNGAMDTGGGTGIAVDVGVAGVTVTGYDSSGAAVGTTTTGATGTYSLSVTGAATSDVRVEFSGFPDGFDPSFVSASAGATVQFVSLADTGVDLAIHVPEENSQANGPLVVPIQRAGDRTNAAISGLPALSVQAWDSGFTTGGGQGSGGSPDYSARGTLATTAEVGAIWGTAFQGSTNNLYAAATLKRHADFGPLGIGGIYRISNVTDSSGALTGSEVVNNWLDVHGMTYVGNGGGTIEVYDTSTYGASDFSAATRGLAGPTVPTRDDIAFTHAAKFGIGGIAVSTDQQTLYFVNLYDKNLYAIDISDPTDTTPEIRQHLLGLGADQWPWGITVYRDQVYVGYVDATDGDASTESAAAASLDAHLIRADENGGGTLGAFSSDLLALDLGYTKGNSTAGGTPTPNTNVARWNEWTDVWTWGGGTGESVGITWYGTPGQTYPQAILSDMQFDEDGYLTLGFGDRTAIQGGNRNWSTSAQAPDTNLYQVVASGDMLMAVESTPGTFTVESNAVVGTRTGAGAGNGEGPGGGEFYNDTHNLGAGTIHRDHSLGGLALVYGANEIVATVYDPLSPVRLNGINWFAASDGDVLSGFMHTADYGGSASGDGGFQKGGGLGDLELLALTAPLQIGDRVWLDSDRDGIQDAGEAGIDGVTVQLYDDTDTLVGTAVTSGGGYYYFDTVTSEAAAGNGDNTGGGLTHGVDHTIQVGIAANYGSGQPLEGLLLTWQDETLASEAYVGQSDALDSDAASGSGVIGTDWFPEISVLGTVIGIGENNHTFDAGFIEVELRDLALRKTVTSATGPLESGSVTYAIEIFNQGSESVNGITVTDYIDTDHFSALASAPSAGTTTGDQSLSYTWSISGGDASATTPQVTIAGTLPAGESVIVPITLTVNPSMTGPQLADAIANGLDNFAEISAFDTDGDAGTGDSTNFWVVDVDSIPDATDSNDGTVEDDVIAEQRWTNDETTSTGPAAGQDEDDHDVATLPLYDLSLIKERASGQDAYIQAAAPATVTWTVTVKNQGNSTVYDVRVQDYVGSGLTLGTQTSPQVDGARTITHLGTGEFSIDRIDPGEEVSFDVVTTATAPETMSPVRVNTAEITQFDNDSNSGNTLPAWVFDIDSTPDTNSGNDATDGSGTVFAEDNHNDIDNAPVNGVNANDEDDHDTEAVAFEGYEVGNLVWFDTDDDGIADLGEPGIAGVTVQLYRESDDALLDTTTTNASGQYQFTDLPAGQYYIVIPDQAALTSLEVTQPVETNVDGDADNDQNGWWRSAPDTGWQSEDFTLGAANEPTGEIDGTTGVAAGPTPGVADARSNYTVDFGFIQRVRIGNQVWRDESDADPTTTAATDNNGVFDAGTGEVGLTGVEVELWIDDGDGVFEPGVAVGSGGDGLSAYDSTTTDSEGNYWFADVPAGRDYFVAANFIWFGMHFNAPRSSSGQSAAVGTADNDDDGNPAGGYFSVTRVFTPTVGGAPTGEVDAVPVADGSAETEADAQTRAYYDNDSNLRIDLGLVEVPLYRLGNKVWLDVDNDGLYETGESALSGVTVQLLNSSGAVLATDVTDAAGEYLFENLVAGEYRVRILDQVALDGLRSSTADGGDPDTDVDDNDDNGVIAGANWQTDLISLGASFDSPFGTEPVNETTRSDTVVDDDSGWTNGPDNHSNLTVDFGFYPLYRVGNVVWQDLDNDGSYETGEPALAGVTVELWVDTDNDGFERGDDDVQIGTDTTDASGNYAFEALDPGDYYVHIPSQAPLSGFATAGTPVANANADADNDNNAVVDGTNGGWTSGEVTLGGDAEPTNEQARANDATDDDDGTAVGSGDDYADNRSNYSVDFGFYGGLRLGNLVWHDESDTDTSTVVATDNNGIVDAGEAVLPGVTVELFVDGGNGTFDAGTGGGDDVSVGTTVTDAEGNYWFEHLSPGTYFAAIETAPANMKSSDVNNAGGAALDNNDNGAPANDGAGDPYASVSGPIVLSINGEPTGESDTIPAADGSAETEANAQVALDYTDDNDSELTVDFGFILEPVYRIGNLVWLDTDRDGVADVGESPIQGVLVELLNSGGTVIARDVTDVNGKYAFEDLAPGLYTVRIPFVQDDPTDVLDGQIVATALQNRISTTDGGTADTDNDDDGAIQTLGWESAQFSLGASSPSYDTEPTTEVLRSGSATDDDTGWANGADNRSQFTIDFGFEQIILVDLALRKTVLSAAGPLDSGTGTVTFQVEVFNQGATTVNGITVSDYIDTTQFDALSAAPAPGITGGDAALAYSWAITGGTATGAKPEVTIVGDLDPGESVTFPITLTVNETMSGGVLADAIANGLDNLAEISWFDTDNNAGTGSSSDGKVVDVDSIPDTTVGNDALEDDEIAETAWTNTASSSTGPTAGQDEDDHDIATVPLWDLSLIKERASTQPAQIAAGAPATVTWTVTVKNQGSTTAYNVRVQDYPGSGLVLGSQSASQSDDGRTISHLGGGLFQIDQVAPGEQISFDVVTTATAPESITPVRVNTAEITQFDNTASTADSIPLWVVDFDSAPDVNPANDALIANGTTYPEDSHNNIDYAPINGVNPTDEDDHDSEAVRFQGYEIGNLVWLDADDDGVADLAESGLAGIAVQLWRDVDLDGVAEPAGDDAAGFVTSVATDAAGTYRFTNLPAGDYFVAIQDQAGLVGLEATSPVVSTQDSNADNDQNGAWDSTDNAWTSQVMTLGAVSEPTSEVDGTTGVAGAPAPAVADNRSNYTVDFGFNQRVRVGNQVFRDESDSNAATSVATDNNGIFDSAVTEVGLAGVTVQLWSDVDTDGVFEPAGDDSAGLVDTTTTDSEGNYWFTDVVPGQPYFVAIPTIGAGFTTPRSSGGQSATVDTADNDDDGNPVGAYISVSTVFTPTAGALPTAEVDARPPADGSAETEATAATRAYDDNDSDLRVDFGFVEVPLYRVGNRVWLDEDNDGVYDASESPIAGVWLELYNSSDVKIGEDVTDATGYYAFENLVAGDYYVQIPKDQSAYAGADGNFDADALEGLDSSSLDGGDVDLIDDPDIDVDDNDDNGIEDTNEWQSDVFTLGASFDSPFGSEPVNEQIDADTATDDDTGWAGGPDSQSNFTVDFGFVPLYRIGNLVWQDLDNDGVAETGESGIAGITVELWVDTDNDGFERGGDDVQLGTDTTDGSGTYAFEELLPGDYYVHIPTGQSTLDGFDAAGVIVTNANGNADNDNNAAVDAGVGGWTSGEVTLGGSAEPTTERLRSNDATDDDDGTAIGAGDDYADNRSNFSVDFGFWGGLRLGNLVWHDESDTDPSTVVATDNNGIVNIGEDVMAGVTVRLFLDGSDATFDAGTGGGDDTLIATTVTDAEGNYWFEHLDAGTYWVAIEALPGSFGDMTSSDVDNAGGAAADNNDNGAPATDGAGDPYISVSSAVVLAVGTEPTGETDTLPTADGSAETEANAVAALDFTDDNDSDLTIDFGFIAVPTYRIGNLVWLDSDRDGSAETAETGIPGVLVELLDDGGTVIARTVTDAAGKYDFDGLAAGDYRVRIPGVQDDPTNVLDAAIIATALDNLISTTDGGTADTDNDDDGAISGANWQSALITVGSTTAPYQTEPTTEVLRVGGADDDAGWSGGTDGHSQFTIDFGFAPGLRLGDTVWLDDGDWNENNGSYVPGNEDNGVYDANEDPIAGIDVELWIDVDDDGTFEPTGDDSAGYVGTEVTDVDGEYFFTGIDELNDYFVAIPSGAGQGDGNDTNATLLANLRSSTPTSAATNTGNDTDHGDPATGYDAVSASITPVRGGMAYGESADEANANTKSGVTLADGDSNLVIDFGFSPVPEYEIGNLVWLDDDDGIAESGESGISGVTVYLFRDLGAATFEPGGGEEDGVAIDSDVTDASGRYEFTGLPAGDYWVFIPEQAALEGLASSEVRQTNAENGVDNDNNAIEFTYLAFDGWAASRVTLGDGADDHSEPTGEADGTTAASAEDGSVRDDRSNQTVDFGFSQRVRIGNQVWRDESDPDPSTEAATDNNGVFDAGSGEVGIVGVTVQLWHDTDGDGFEGATSDDVLVDTTTTNGEGNYYFIDVVPDTNYYVAIPSDPFTDARSSGGQSTAVDTADNDDDGAVSGAYASVSRVVNLTAGGEPTGETDPVPAADGSAEIEANTATSETYDDNDSNLRVDFGFIETPLYRIGNRVWLDTDNDGIAESGEPGIEGVLVQLRNSSGTVIAETTTDSTGQYVFENLAAGDYSIRIPQDQTADLGPQPGIAAGALSNLASSTTDATNANDDADNDDNGVLNAPDWDSSTVTLGDTDVDAAINTEPTNEDLRANDATDDDAGWPNGPDSHSNFSVDFGFYELLRIGNYVWLDDGGSPYVVADEDDRQADTNESEIQDVDVELWRDVDDDGNFEPSGDDSTGYVGTDVTDTDGEYYFTGLTEGNYFVVIPAGAGNAAGLNSNATQLADLRSSTGQESSDATDSRDQGAPETGYAAASNQVTLVAGGMTQSDSAAESTANTKTGVTVSDASSLLTIDFGFSPVPEYAIGNIVWYDYDDDGVADSGEPGIVGVDVELWLDGGNGTFDDGTGDDTLIGTDTTDAAGRYLFDNLDTGDYFVHIPGSQTELDGFRTSGTPDATPDDGGDNDNNAVVDATYGGWTGAAPITLGGAAGPADNDEPTGETDGTTGADAEAPVSVRDDRSDQTVDFGFHQGLRLGNHVWLDEGAGTAQNNGLLDNDAAEVDIANVDVQLWQDGGDATFDAGAGDDTLIGTDTTDTDGIYLFENLEPGSYWAAVPSVPGGGVQSSTNRSGNAPSLAVDAQDDGEPSGAYLSVSPLYTLSVGGAPTGEVNDFGAAGSAETDANAATGTYRDADSYLTVDFGFIDVPLFRIGNLVWQDHDADGVAETGEPGIEGVLVQLYTDADVLIGETVTDSAGKYEFTNLAAGDVYIVIPEVQFTANASLNALIDVTALDGFIASPVDATPNNNQDNDNNVQNTGTVWESALVTLGPETAGSDPDVEPEDEQLRSDDATDDDAGQSGPPRIDDDRSNYTVDAGFYSVSVGNLVFIDLDGDGVYEPGDGDSSVNGVTVNLRLASDDSLVATAITAGTGLYLFDGLTDGTDYYVEIPAAEFATGGDLEGYFSSPGNTDPEASETDGTDKGIDPAALYGAVNSATFTAEAGSEWTTDGTGVNVDNDNVRSDDSEDLTVDFGFTRLELGGNVFEDPQNDGIDDADSYFENVTMLLFNGDGTPFLRPDGSQANTLTDVNGDYVFTDLPPGDFIVEIPATQFASGGPLEHFGSSDGNDVAGFAPDPDNDVSGEDNGDPVGGDLFAGNAVRSQVVTLSAGPEPTDDTDPSAPTPDGNSNRSVDFGFWVTQLYLELGNQIWFDDNPDGLFNLADDRPAPAGVVIELWDAFDDSAPFDTTTTDGDGQYLFTLLPAGAYYVVLPSVNFQAGGPLENYTVTDGAGVSVIPDDGTDSDSNGEDSGAFSVRTAVFSFFSEMPVGEGDPFVSVIDDRLSDLTIDIGLIEGTLAITGIELEPLIRWTLILVLSGIVLIVVGYRTRRDEDDDEPVAGPAYA